ncbi:MAG TPA: ornithine carbamoyltransferase [Holophaga sp.]|nr:ornithine carbamoyltransferase [Holophaga sp.]
MLTQGHFISLSDYASCDIRLLLDTADEMKKHPAAFRKALDGKILTMIFEVPFPRTRISFESGMHRLGGTTQLISGDEIQLDWDEPVSDTASVLARYADGIMVRACEHQVVRDMAACSRIPVINGMTDLEHPCQALADLQTLRERFGRLEGLRLTYIGDGNNMAHALLYATARAGMDCTLVMPGIERFQCAPSVVERAAEEHRRQGTRLCITDDLEAVRESHVVYTDTWVSVGKEADRLKRIEAFRRYSVTQGIMDLAGPEAVFMHCLPACRGYEVTAEVIDGPRSIVYDQAENRMWTQMAVMHHLMGKA